MLSLLFPYLDRRCQKISNRILYAIYKLKQRGKKISQILKRRSFPDPVIDYRSNRCFADLLANPRSAVCKRIIRPFFYNIFSNPPADIKRDLFGVDFERKLPCRIQNRRVGLNMNGSRGYFRRCSGHSALGIGSVSVSIDTSFLNSSVILAGNSANGAPSSVSVKIDHVDRVVLQKAIYMDIRVLPARIHADKTVGSSRNITRTVVDQTVAVADNAIDSHIGIVVDDPLGFT